MPAATHIQLTFISVAPPICKQALSSVSLYCPSQPKEGHCTYLLSVFLQILALSFVILTTPNDGQTLWCSSCCHYCLIFFSRRTIKSHPSTPVLIFLLSPLTPFSETRVLKEWGFGLPLHVGFSSEELWWGSLGGSLHPFRCLSWSVCMPPHIVSALQWARATV